MSETTDPVVPAGAGRISLEGAYNFRDIGERVPHPDRLEGLAVDHHSVPLHDDQWMNAKGVIQPAVDEQYRLYADRFAHRVAEAVGVVLRPITAMRGSLSAHSRERRRCLAAASSRRCSTL